MTGLHREEVALADLTPHPQNYRSHPEDQIEHLAASIKQFGFFRNIVIARDGTILAGHGIVEAARRLGIESVPAVRLDLAPESPDALKVLAADNELTRFAEVDDRALTELLRQIADDTTDGLLGTGYDEMILANLVMVTRTADEIADFDAAAEWVGMPEYEPLNIWRLIVQFDTEELRREFMERFASEVVVTRRSSQRSLSGWWPEQPVGMNDSGLRWDEERAGE